MSYCHHEQCCRKRKWLAQLDMAHGSHGGYEGLSLRPVPGVSGRSLGGFQSPLLCGGDGVNADWRAFCVCHTAFQAELSSALEPKTSFTADSCAQRPHRAWIAHGER